MFYCIICYCVYVHIGKLMYACMHACMYVRAYVRMCVCVYLSMYASMYCLRCIQCIPELRVLGSSLVIGN